MNNQRARTPRAIVDQLNAAINRALREDDVKQSLNGVGVLITGGSSQQLATRIRTDVGRWNRVVRETGVKPEA